MTKLLSTKEINAPVGQSFRLSVLFIFFIFISCSDNRSVIQNQVNNSLSGLLPIVKKFSLSGNNFLFKGNWSIAENAVVEKTIASETLREKLKLIGSISLTEDTSSKIELSISPGSVTIGEAVDTNKTILAQQAYELQLGQDKIRITANAEQGLYYGVQTFVQMLQNAKDEISLPEGDIIDWPDLSLRMIYWDDAHHLEKFDALKRIIRQASEYKINAFALKLEGHFEFASASHLIEPFAISPQQYQELTDYARSYFVELVPYLDAPAHISFILKHPEYAKFRLYPDNNYELSMTNSKAVELMKNMFADLMRANRGGKYIVLSTDEAYYAGKGPSEKEAAAQAGSNGKLLAHFIKTVADELNDQGRTILFWGEYPLVASDIDSLPSYLVSGVYNEMSETFRKHGIRQLVYTYTQGEEPIFPSYYPVNKKDTITRVGNIVKDIRTAVDEKKSMLMGVFIAGWSDAGLHPETFWLGYTTGAAMGWNVSSNADDLTNRFFTSFYHRDSSTMKKIYQMLSIQAGFYDRSWEWVPSDFRKPILGNSEGIFPKPERVKDQVLPMLPVPSAGRLSKLFSWDTLIPVFGQEDHYENDIKDLMNLITTNCSSEVQSYNWDVLHSVAMLCAQSLHMRAQLENMNHYLGGADINAKDGHFKVAVNYIDSALATAAKVKSERDSVFARVKKIWYEEWLPLVPVANSRRFLHELDDIKDHRPGRTIDLSYLIYRQLNFPLGRWAAETLKSRNTYARAHGLPVLDYKLEWDKYE